MKGVVFNMLERLVNREHGEDVWDELLSEAELDGAYTSLGSYPDEDLFALVGAASSKLAVPADDIVRWFGRESIPMFAEAYPALFTPYDGAQDFIRTINRIVHPQVRKLYPGADVPDFGFPGDVAPDRLTMIYRSPRQMCAFAEGLVAGTAAYFGERVTIEQPTCLKRGDAACTLEMRFAR